MLRKNVAGPFASLMFTGLLLASTATGPVPKVDSDVRIVATGGLWEHGGRYGTSRVVVREQGWEEVSTNVMLEWLVTNETKKSREVLASVPLAELNEHGWNNVQQVTWVGGCKFEVSYLKLGEEGPGHLATVTLLDVRKYQFQKK